MEILRKNKKEMLEVKNIVTEMKTEFDYQKKHSEERTAELDNISIETSKSEKRRGKRLKSLREHSQELWAMTRGVTYA